MFPFRHTSSTLAPCCNASQHSWHEMMKPDFSWSAIFSIAAVLTVMPDLASTAEAPADLAPVTVTATRDALPVQESVFSISRIDDAEIDLIGATHPNELFARVPGAWISRGSGQEHLTAIRSPVLTGAGACGAFLYLEDGIPVRPAGFCNVNQLFEINTEQADAIEVLRGPGSVIYGSNAVHGVINVLHEPLRLPLNEISVNIGEYGYRQLNLDHAGVNVYGGWRLKYLGETADSNQIDAGHEQHKLNFGWHGDNWRAQVAATSLDQDTAGYIIGENAYRDPVARRGNPNPEAFRKADSLRTWAVWKRDLARDLHLELRPYARHSDMDFLQHFLPGKPLEENGQTSAGVISTLVLTDPMTEWRFGLDAEWADGWLRETQDAPVADGSDFLRETRPVGKHYDYTVTQHALSPWLHVEHDFNNATTAVAGVRADWIRYDYDNRMQTGNTRADGSVCGFGGCIYNRPADRSDTFTAISPKLGVRHAVSDYTFYGNLVRGFRVPQATELYRLQRGQDVAELDPEQINSIEAGLRASRDAVDFDIALFAMEKRNVIFRDAEGFNVSDGRTRHRGVEFDIAWRAMETWLLALRGTYARHTYAFDYQPANGESFSKGDDIDTSPRWLGSAIAGWQASPATTLELEYQHVGPYFLDAENTQRYSGHGLWHFRWGQQLGDFVLQLRVNNLLDADYAERADYAFGNFRYFPGWRRRIIIGVDYSF